MRTKAWILAAITCSAAFAGDDVPGWFREFASTKTPAYSGKVPSVVLLDEGRVSVEENGKTVTSARWMVKVLNREGRRDAQASTAYNNDQKVKEFRAWLMTPSGDVLKYGKDRILDVALAENDVYNEVRARKVVAGDDAVVGAVFGYESV